MHTLSAMAKALNRDPRFLRGLMTRFELPLFPGAGYSDSYLEFLRTLLRLRALNISESSLLDLWRVEKALLRLLHADSTGSPTWFLDACGPTGHANRRLLLSNFDMGLTLDSNVVQLGLNFRQQAPELFSDQEMSADIRAILHRYIKLHKPIISAIRAEIPHLRTTLRFARSKTKTPTPPDP